MKKIFSFFFALMACATMGFATTITLPEKTLDLQTPTMVTDSAWNGAKAYFLDDDVFITSGQESRLCTATQTWISFASTGSSNSTWAASAPFKGSDYYTNKAYATLQAGRYTAYRITGCDSVWVYGYNNANSSKYLVTNIYDITGSSAESIDDASVSATYSISNEAAGKTDVILKQALDADKTYLVVTTGKGSSNSRVYEVAFFRHPSDVATPSVSADVDEIDFGTVEQGEGEGYLNKTFKLTGKNLTAGVRLNPLGAIFSVDPIVINPDGDGKIDATITVTAQTGWTGVQDNVINVTSEKDPEEFDWFKLMDLKMNVIAPLPTIKVNGSWDWEAPVTLVAAGDKKTASATHTFATAQTVEFGVLVGENWKSNGSEVTVTRANNSVALTGYTGNMNLDIDQPGEYTFTWEYETNTITVAYPEIVIDPTKHDTLFAYNGKGTTNAEAVIFQGGTLTAYGYGQPGPEGMNGNMTYNSSQKGNMTIKIGKGYHKDAAGEGYYFMGITLDKALEEGDLIQVAAFRTGNTACVFGMDFNVATDSASATTDCQVLIDNLQILASNGIPNDTVFVVPAAAVGAKYIRLYRNSGSTGLYIANFSVYREKSVEPAHTYSLVGPLSPAGWDEKSNLGDMTLNEGVYSITVEDVILTKATSYEYKIVEDHAWTVAFPQEGNAAFTVEKSGKYDVTFTLNASTKAYAANPVLKEEIAVKHKFAVLGGFNSWSADATEVDEDAATASFVVNIAEAANFEFKVKVNDAWLANGYTYHRDFTGAAGITANGDNMVLTADVAGDYTFTWTFETKALEITFPAKGPGTGINDIDAEGKVEKIFRDGKFYILKGEKTYTIQGQLVK